ncbi:MAG: DUF1566 domain-containing protein, partial [Chloroflexi bacterium]|nr:DUF1566 domain-containing protein [Chloroflexota bacterium]
DFFTVAGADSVSNDADSGVVTAVFPTTEYAIGDTGPAGGLIFYIDTADAYTWAYLEVWTSDESGTYQWKTSQTSTAGTLTTIGAGYANTYTHMTGTEHPAANVVRNATHGGFNDWFLPSKDELDAIWDNLVDDGNGSNSGVGGFAGGYYWSSSESFSNYAWIQYFNDGHQFDYDKGYSGRVRAVRAF